jgi:cell division protein FtsB
MTEVTVDISDKVIDTAAKKELKRLTAQVGRLKEQIAKLKRQIRDQQFKSDEANRIVTVASAIAAEFGDKWGDA